VNPAIRADIYVFPVTLYIPAAVAESTSLCSLRSPDLRFFSKTFGSPRLLRPFPVPWVLPQDERKGTLSFSPTARPP